MISNNGTQARGQHNSRSSLKSSRFSLRLQNCFDRLGSATCRVSGDFPRLLFQAHFGAAVWLTTLLTITDSRYLAGHKDIGFLFLSL